MCDAICSNEKKYALGPIPYFPPPIVNTYPCQAIEVDTPIYEPLVKPVIKNIIQETTINVPKIEYRERIVEVPKVEYRPYPVIKEVEAPIYQDKYKYRDVPVSQKQYRIKPIYKEVSVPEIQYVDKYVTKKYKRFKYIPKEVQIPFRPKKEIYEEIPVPRYIPQHLESVMQSDALIGQTPYPNHQIGFCEKHDANVIDILSPVKPFKEQTRNKCCLDSLFSPPKKSYEVNMPLPVPILPPMVPPHVFNTENQLHGINPTADVYAPFPHLPHAHGVLGFSHPFIVEEEEKDFCNCLIETTSNVLAASGVALILAGKLTYEGINYLMKITGNKKKNDESYNNSNNESNDETNESNQIESTHETLKSEKTYSFQSNDQIDDTL